MAAYMVMNLTNRGLTMSKIMIYATTDKVGGNIENVWGYDMLAKAINGDDKDEVEQAKAEGWTNKAQDVIEQIEAQKMQKENTAIKGQLAIGADKARIDELEGQLATALGEVAGFESERAEADTVIDEKVARISELEQKLAVYEAAKDTNSDGKVSYDEMTNAELQALLDQRKVEYNKRDGKDALIQKLKDSE